MEMNEIIEVETLITYDLFKEYYLFNAFKGKRYKYGPIMFYVTCVIGMILPLSISLLYGWDPTDIVLPMVFAVVIVLFSVFIFYMPKKHYSAAQKFLESPNIYRFTEEHLFVESKSQMTSGTSQIKYEALHRVYELENMIYIFIRNSEAFLVAKNNFSPGDLQKVRNTLANKLGKKYLKYCKD